MVVRGIRYVGRMGVSLNLNLGNVAKCAVFLIEKGNLRWI